MRVELVRRSSGSGVVVLVLVVVMVVGMMGCCGGVLVRVVPGVKDVWLVGTRGKSKKRETFS